MTAAASQPTLAAPSREPGDDAGAGRWGQARLAAALLAVDPHGLGGVVLRSPPSAARDHWTTMFRALLAQGVPVRRVPGNISVARLVGGLDLSATLIANRPIAERGLMSEADGGVLIVPGAERLPAATSALLTLALDRGEVRLERDGLATTDPSRFAVIAFDEGYEADERVPAALADRLAFHIGLDGLRVADDCGDDIVPADVARADHVLHTITLPDDAIAAVCQAAEAMGIRSQRAVLLAVRAAKASAALFGRSAVADDDVIVAGRLVLAPRATQFPAPADDAEQPHPPDPPPPNENEQDTESHDEAISEQPLEDRILAAAEAALPPDVLAMLRASSLAARKSKAPTGRSGIAQKSQLRGRPIGVLRGVPRSGQRLNVIETLRAAVPWQRLRRQHRLVSPNQARSPRVEVRKDDFRISRHKARTATVTIFVVDASGSAALHRLAEAKGAVELLLADCYIRRDCVALIAFRGQSAEVLLPPTRSLARVKRSLADLPGGGGTPLAAGLDAAALLADTARRKGQTPTLVVLTDGRANVARAPSAGKAQAAQDATDAARVIRAQGWKALLIDTSPQPQAQAAHIAHEMGGLYLPLPHAGAAEVSAAVKAVGR